MIENKIVYLNSLLKDQREIPKVVSKDPLLKQISQEKADEYVNNLKCNFLTILSENYPNSLKILPNPPWIIYYKGNIDLLKKVLISVIGTSNPSMYGLKATADVIRIINKEKALVCENKNGICKQAIMSAIANEISIVSISNCVDDFKSDFIKRIVDKNLVITINLKEKCDQSWFDKVQMVLSKELIVIE
ncbi:MAG: DNA-processing protein DprA, partial [Mycoplasmatales bacterium]